MTTAFHAWLCHRFMEIQSKVRGKKLLTTDQGSNFLGGTFSNKDKESATIQLRRQSQSQHLKRLFFFKNRPINFHINSTSVN